MAVFAHGQLRLYLLALLNEGPRHGYEIIRALEERFNGLYSPSAGTVYPRLAKLEEEGLVERTDDGRKATYRITDGGRNEVAAREFDLADLQQDLDHSASELAQQVRQRVHGSSKDLRAELKAAAKQARANATPAGTSYETQWPAGAGRNGAGATTVRDIESAINAFRFEVRDAVRRVGDDAARQEILDVLAEAAQKIRTVLHPAAKEQEPQP
jgi:DNA-binding PadR family transcriptional regulator